MDAVVTHVDDEDGPHPRALCGDARVMIDLETMSWARRPDANVRSRDAAIRKPSVALKTGDVIQVKVLGPKLQVRPPRQDARRQTTANSPSPTSRGFARVELEQEPIVDGALCSRSTRRPSDVITMVGGYDLREAHSSTARIPGRAPDRLVVQSLRLPLGARQRVHAGHAHHRRARWSSTRAKKGQEAGKPGEAKTWKPKNNSNKFAGDVLFRNALIKSLNVPTVKVMERVGVDWGATYARRLGIFSPLNMDFTLALGSSGVTLYEMTRAFGTIGRMGQRLSPVLVRRVVDAGGREIAKDLTLDDRFKTELGRIEDDFETRRQNYLKTTEHGKKEPPIYFADKNQLVRPQTAYVLTTMLQGVVDEAGGTGGAARALGRPVAGKTGTTSAFYDAWFMGYTPDIATGVWVGFDEEKTIGRGEVGGIAALPIWLDYMKMAHEGLPPRGFPVPDGITFANIDNESGQLVSSGSKSVVRQAFIDGTEPGTVENKKQVDREADKNFLKEEMGE